MGAGGGLGMVLDGEGAAIAEPKALAGAVVEIDVGHGDVGALEAIGVGGEAVVLGGDGDRAGGEVLDWLVSAAVAEFEFEGAAAEGVGEDLVAEADAEEGFLAEDVPDDLVGVGEHLGIARPVGEEDAVRVAREGVRGRGRGRDHAGAESVLAEASQDVVLDAEIVGDDPIFGGGQGPPIAGLAVQRPSGAEGVLRVPVVGFGGGDLLDEIDAHVLDLTGQIDGGGIGERLGGQDPAEGAVDPQAPGERPRIDPLDRGDPVEFQVLIAAPSSIMNSRLTQSALTVLMAALLSVVLLTLPAIMIYRALFDLEKERTNTLEKELKLAYDIQMSLLPQGTVRVPGLDIFGDSIPARHVGGDFFDICPVGEHQLIVTVGDVSGKGMASALMMARVKTLISFISRQELNPVNVLREVNSFLVGDSDSTLFSTVLLGFIDTERSTFAYAVAGHNPPLLVRDGNLAELEGTGTVLGVFEKATFDLKETALRKGDLLLLYTDGFTDIWNEKREKIDEAWLWESALEARGARAEETARRIFARAADFEGDHRQFDDRTLVVIKVHGK